jgi:hypothetical protein
MFTLLCIYLISSITDIASPWLTEYIDNNSALTWHKIDEA